MSSSVSASIERARLAGRSSSVAPGGALARVPRTVSAIAVTRRLVGDRDRRRREGDRRPRTSRDGEGQRVERDRVGAEREPIVQQRSLPAVNDGGRCRDARRRASDRGMSGTLIVAGTAPGLSSTYSRAAAWTAWSSRAAERAVRLRRRRRRRCGHRSGDAAVRPRGARCRWRGRDCRECRLPARARAATTGRTSA